METSETTKPQIPEKKTSAFKKWTKNHVEAIFFIGVGIGMILFYASFILWGIFA